MSNNLLLKMVEEWGGPRILVCGDAMLDRYTFGRIDRRSQEADVPIVLHERTEERPGGAASVAMMCRALGARVTLAGLIGDDRAGDKLEALLFNAGVDTAITLDMRRRTTVKERFLVDGKQVGLRLDRETVAPPPAGFHEAIIKDVQHGDYDVVLVSDYGKGAVRGLDLRQLQGVPVIVDPAMGVSWNEIYQGCSLVKCNYCEKPNQIHHKFPVIVTIGNRGMLLYEFVPRVEKMQGVWFDPRPSNAIDPTGCGDQVMAVLGMAAGAKQSWEDACRVAVAAAGMQTERIGCVPVTKEELLCELSSQMDVGISCTSAMSTY